MILTLNIVGRASFKVGDRVHSQAAKHLFAMVLRLALDPGHTVSREELIAFVFPTAKTSSAGLQTLRQLLYKARSEGVPIVVTPEGLRIDAADVCSDLELFLATDQAMAPPEVRPVEVLKGYRPLRSPGFVRWLEGAREQIESAMRLSLVQAIESLKAQGNWVRVEARARECLSTDRLNETATLALAEALARSGSKERALTMLSAYRQEVELEARELALPASLLEKRIALEANSPTARQPEFCGREVEMNRLMQHWKRSRGGGVAISIVAGEAGFGKTRLLDEFLRSMPLGASKSVIRVGHSSPLSFRPLGMLAEIVSALLQLRGAAGCEPELLPCLHRLVDAGTLDEPTKVQNDRRPLITTMLHCAIVDLVRAVSWARHIAIRIDARAMDAATIRFFEHLRAVEGVRIHLMIECALSDLPGLAVLSNTPIVLRGLGDTEARSMLRFVTTRGLAKADADWIIACAGGNPAFILSLLSHHNHAGRVRSFPAELVSAVDARIDALPTPYRIVLETCVALECSCSVSSLAEVLGMPAYSLLAALNHLESHSFIHCEDGYIRACSNLLSERVRANASSSGYGLLDSRIASSRSVAAGERHHLIASARN